MKSFSAIALGLGAAVLLQGACVALDEAQSVAGGEPPTSSGTSGSSGVGGGDAGIDAAFGDGGGPQALTYASLCGDGCKPETGQAGSCVPPDDGAGGAGGGAAAGGAGGMGGDGTGGSGVGGSAGGEPAPDAQCVLLADTEGMHGLCAEAGVAVAGGPCLGTSDCGSGLGCVAPGVCRPYCCGDLEACPTQSYCEPTPVAGPDVPDGVSAAPVIPVCVPATMCELLEDAASCPPNKTCTIVRADGTTSCVTPGLGEQADGCPCAAGFVCSTADNTCYQLCHLDRPEECPAKHLCQGGSTSYPPNFGVCVEN